MLITPKLLKGVRDGRSPLHPMNPSLIMLPAMINNSLVHAMLDTGASHSLIMKSFLQNIPHTWVKMSDTPTALLGDGSTNIPTHGLVRFCARFHRIPTYVFAFVVDSLGVDFILGTDWCRRYNIVLHMRQQQLTLQHPHYGSTTIQFHDTLSVPVRLKRSVRLPASHERVVQLTTPLSSASQVSFTPDFNLCRRRKLFIPEAVLHINHFQTCILICNLAQTSITLRENTIIGHMTFFSHLSNALKLSSITAHPCSHTTAPPEHTSLVESKIHLTHSDVDSTICELTRPIASDDDRTAFTKILQKHRRVFDTSKHTIARTHLPHIIVTGDHPPVSVRPYYRTVEQRKELQQEIDKLLLDNIVRPSTSPWSSPVILKKKPDGTFRFLVDFRRLNAITKKDAYPQPSAEELLYRLSGHSYFTKLDLKSGYFQIPIAESDKEKTGFITPDGHYEFNVLPQGLMNAPASFQRVMNNLIATGRWDYVVIYLDDIVIFSHSIEEHKQHVDEILTILNEAHFKVSPAKCTIAARQIEFLGHMVTSTMVEPTPDKIQAILDIPAPRTLSQANRFLGKVNYYRKFIADFAHIAAPLYKVTNKTRTKRHEFYWHAEQQAAFEQFKKILTTAPLFLHFPDPSLPFILSTDASLTRIAGVLKQDTPDGLKVCYYKSRLLSDIEARYSTTEREALAICWCLEQLRPCIGNSSIIIETDHQPLSNMHKNLSLRNKRIDNWLLKLQDLLPQIVTIKYRKGIDNVGPDFLTRYNPQDSVASTADHLLQHSASIEPELPASDMNQSIESRDQIFLSSVVTRSKTRATSNALPVTTLPYPTGKDDAGSIASDSNLDSARSRKPPLLSTSELSSSSDPSLDLSLPRIRTAQHLDSAILSVIDRLQRTSTTTEFTLVDNVVYRVASGRYPQVPYLPQSLIPLVLNLYHDHPLSGHFGVHRTTSRISSKFWWPKMRSQIRNYIASCPQCSAHNISRTKPLGHLKSLEPPQSVFQVLHMDFWGPVRTPTSRGNRYVIILTDNLSKYVIAKALPDCSAQSAAQFLIDHFILVHGAPERIITDNGKHFNNHLLHTISKSMHIPHNFSATYHPQTNGQVERFNATFATQLAKYCDSERNDWDCYLPSIIYAYNTSIHSTTKIAPYELAFARQPKSPFEPVSSCITEPTPHSFYPYLRQVREILTKEAQINIRQHQSSWQQRYNKNRRDMSYRKGDLVYVSIAQGRSKLDPRRQGPYSIIETSGQQHYLVKDDNTGRTDWCHVNQLSPVAHRHALFT